MTWTGNRRALVRPHMITGGRAVPTHDVFDDISIIRLHEDAEHRDDVALMAPEPRRVLQLCRFGGLSVAEIAAHLRLPVTAVKVLLSDLLDTGHIIATHQITPAPRDHSHDFLERVLSGLRNL